MANLEDNSRTYANSLNQCTQSFNVLQRLKSMPLEVFGININGERCLNKNQMFELNNNDFNENCSDRKEEKSCGDYSKELHHINTSLTALQENCCKDNNQVNCIVPHNQNIPFNEFQISSKVLQALIENYATKSPSKIPNLCESCEGNGKEKHIPQDIQELIYALQMGGSRCKMEAAITVRSLATSHHIFQSIFTEIGGINPLVHLLKYVAKEAHWPTELKAKATITIRAEVALALASLSVNNDYNKDAIGAAGAIPLLCELIQFNENNCNPVIPFNYNSQEMASFLILAQDAGAGALSCLSKSEKNKQAIIASQGVPVLIHMIDEGTSFGRIVAANVIAKLATGQNANSNRLILGQEAGAIIPLLQLLRNGSSKAKQTAAEALENLAMHDWNKDKILQEGGVECLKHLLEYGALAEKEAASAALKVLETCTSSEIIQIHKKKDNDTRSLHLVDESNQPSLNTSRHVENMDVENLDNSMGYKNRILIQNKEMSVDLISTTTMNKMQHLNTCINGNLQSSKESIMLQKGHLEKNLILPKIQIMSNLELTSTLAPPLVGQPSMQVDAILDNVKKPLYSNLSISKRMKMTNYDISNQNLNMSYKKGSLVSDSNAQKRMNQPINNSINPRYFDVNKKKMDQFLWKKNNELLHQKNQCFPTIEGCGVANMIKDQQTRQCLVVDKQLVAGGIVALVNALSSSNPSAQEFAALALMLLASQGGFDVKTTITDAGAIPLLLSMVGSSPCPMIRESAAAAIAKLVSYHHVNRSHVLKAGGIKAMVNMAQWSTTLIEDASSIENIKARVQAGAVVAVLNIGNMQDRQNTGMGLQDALPILIQMLESNDRNEVEASVGGIQALTTNFESIKQPQEEENFNSTEQGISQIIIHGTIAIEMVTVLLYLTRSNSKSIKVAALEVLVGFRQNPIWNRLKAFDPKSILSQGETTNISQLSDDVQWNGVQSLSSMLEKCPTSARESVLAAFACAMASEKLSIYVIEEGSIIQQLMIILEEGPTMAIRVSAAALLANIGARNKKLNIFSRENISLLLQLLTSNEYETSHWEESLAYNTSTRNNILGVLMPPILLREHITAIIVYIALSGDFEKQLLTTLGAAPILVGVLRGCLSNAYCNTIQESWKYTQSMSKSRGVVSSVPPYLHATQEFAIMGLIMLADKNIETMESIVENGGISLLVKMLTAIVECKGKVGANWSEMAAAALLTLAGSNNARDEIVRVGGISSLIQILRSEGGAFQFSLTGLAAMAQLLGILGLNSEKTKLRMAEEGAVKCLVDILSGSGNFYGQLSTHFKSEESLKYIALAQEAAAAALATIILNCKTNAQTTVQAGAINHLVKLLDPIIPDCDDFSNLESKNSLLPSTYTLARSKVSFSINSTTSNSNFKLDLKGGDSKKNTTLSDEDLVEVGSLAGGSLAALAALGNIVSCYPQCWREIVNAGIAPRLASLLKGGTWVNNDKQSNKPLQHQNCNAFPTKIQESAALVYDLLLDCEKNNCSP